MADLPSWYPDDDEAKPAPMPLLRIQAFLNTWDVGEGADLLADPDAARRWLVDAGLLDPTAPLGASDLELARDVREAIRGMLVTGRADGGGGPDLASLRRLTAANLARMTIGADGVLGLESAEDGSLGCGLFDLLLIARQAQQNGTWSRLKVCANSECQWAFYDRSRNQQGNWCDMAVCGNRLKNRELRARRR
jgi:predicted RNA-binding Zn ribbon-like protein